MVCLQHCFIPGAFGSNGQHQQWPRLEAGAEFVHTQLSLLNKWQLVEVLDKIYLIFTILYGKKNVFFCYGAGAGVPFF